jgi:hypothetical protein
LKICIEVKTTLATQELGLRPAITPIGETASGAPLAGLTGVDEYDLTSSAYVLYSRELHQLYYQKKIITVI